MSSRLEWLLGFLGLPSTCHAPVESRSTAPGKMDIQTALGELSYVLNSEDRLPVISALLEYRPELVSEDERTELRIELSTRLIPLALTLRQPFDQDRLPEILRTIARACIIEHVDWEPCACCKGKGQVKVMADDGRGVIDQRCPKCSGATRLKWSDRKRSRQLRLSLSTAQHRWLELYDWGVKILQAMRNDGLRAIRRRR